MFRQPSVYDDLNPEEDLLWETFEDCLEFSLNGESISVSSLSLELRLLTMIMFHNLYPFSSIRYMNLRRALFLHNLINDEEIDICSYIFHILSKIAERTTLRNCILFATPFQQFWSSKAFIHWKMSLPTLSQVWSTFVLLMPASVTAKRESSKRVLLIMVVLTLAHILMMRS